MVNVELLPEVNSKSNLSLLDEPLTALFCSNRCPGDLILKTYDLARAMRGAGVPVRLHRLHTLEFTKEHYQVFQFLRVFRFHSVGIEVHYIVSFFPHPV